jgi:hypothetical protein
LLGESVDVPVHRHPRYIEMRDQIFGPHMSQPKDMIRNGFAQLQGLHVSISSARSMAKSGGTVKTAVRWRPARGDVASGAVRRAAPPPRARAAEEAGRDDLSASAARSGR